MAVVKVRLSRQAIAENATDKQIADGAAKIALSLLHELRADGKEIKPMLLTVWIDAR